MVERDIESLSNLVNLKGEEAVQYNLDVDCVEFDFVDLEDGVDGDGDPDDRLGAVEGRRRDQTIVRGLDHQLAAAHLSANKGCFLTSIILWRKHINTEKCVKNIKTQTNYDKTYKLKQIVTKHISTNMTKT